MKECREKIDKRQDLQVWELGYWSTDVEEDNDTSEEEEAKEDDYYDEEDSEQDPTEQI